MAKTAAATLDNLEIIDPSVDSYISPESKEQALKQLHDGVIEGLPEKKEPIPYSHRGFADLTETSLGEATENVTRSGYNQALDDVTKFIGEYFGVEK